MSPDGSVTIREVGPRDGLQAERPVSVESRVRLVEALVETGLRDIEAVSFVSERAVPSMAGAAEVMRQLVHLDSVQFFALVPNVRGAEMALEAGVDALTVTVSASPAYSERNVRMSIDESVEQVGLIVKLRPGLEIDAVVSCAFGSPYEGDIDTEEVLRLGDRLLDAGVTSITYADTTGMATPTAIDEFLHQVGVRIGLHLHDVRGTALVNAFRAWQLGVRRFDTSIGGLGGSPFAEGSAGNLATEELVYVLDEAGAETGCDLRALMRAGRVAAELTQHDLPSRLAIAGLRDGPGPGR
jgi:hydroxymethylglutaryl-CoA lyase